jgi:hypothetical protein
MIRHAKKITAATGATVLSLGLAAPALAHDSKPQDSSKPAASQARTHQALTVEELRARLTQIIEARLAWIETAQSRVADSDRLSDEQKTAVLARLQSAQDNLSALEASVGAATSKGDVLEAVKAAGVRGLLFKSHWGHLNSWHSDDFRDGRVKNDDDPDEKSGVEDKSDDRGATAPSNVSNTRKSTWISFRHNGDNRGDDDDKRGHCDGRDDDDDRSGRWDDSDRGDRGDRSGWDGSRGERDGDHDKGGDDHDDD